MVPALALASIGLQLGGNLLAVGENFDAAMQDARALEFQADKVTKEGKELSFQIRKQGETVLGSATVGLATSGFRLDTAQGVEIRDEIIKNVEYDAMNAVLSGQLQATSMRAQAREIRRAARSGRRLGGLTSVLGGGLSLIGANK